MAQFRQSGVDRTYLDPHGGVTAPGRSRHSRRPGKAPFRVTTGAIAVILALALRVGFSSHHLLSRHGEIRSRLNDGNVGRKLESRLGLKGAISRVLRFDKVSSKVGWDSRYWDRDKTGGGTATMSRRTRSSPATVAGLWRMRRLGFDGTIWQIMDCTMSAGGQSWILTGRNMRMRGRRRSQLPRGSLGWPLIGETLEVMSCAYSPCPERFMDKRRIIAEVNRFILQSDASIFVPSNPKFLTELIGKSSILSINGSLQRRVHGLIGTFLKSPSLKAQITLDMQNYLEGIDGLLEG